MINDMTKGSPFKILWKFSLPMLLSMMFQQLYNIVDSMVAGNFIGKNGLAAVGASYPITILFISVASGASMGCSVLVSQTFGERNYAKLKSAISTTMYSLFVLSIIMTILGIFICNPIMKQIHTPENIFNDSALYLRIYIFGLVFLFLYNAATAVFTALGDSKTPLYFLIFSSILNIVLDLVFVILLHMGVAGVAWATFIAQGISSVLVVTTLYGRTKKITGNGAVKLFDSKLLWVMTKLSVPSILQQSFVSVGQVFLQGIINSFGADVVAGYSASFKINTFVVMSIMTMANAFSSYTAQNIGAGKPERVKQGYRTALIMALSITASAVLFELSCTKEILELFVNDEGNQEVILAGSRFLRVVAPFHFVVATKLITDAVLRGTGVMYQFMITTFSDLILRVLLSFLLAPFMGFDGICWSFPIGWAAGCLVSLLFYFSGGWKKYAEKRKLL